MEDLGYTMGYTLCDKCTHMVSCPSPVNIQDSGCKMTLQACKDAGAKNKEVQQLYRNNIYQVQTTAEDILLSSSVVSAAPATERGEGSTACLQFC